MRQAFFVAMTHFAIGGNTLRLQNQVLVDASDVIPPLDGVTPPTIAIAPTTGATPAPAGTAAATKTATSAEEVSKAPSPKKGSLYGNIKRATTKVVG